MKPPRDLADLSRTARDLANENETARVRAFKTSDEFGSSVGAKTGIELNVHPPV